MSSWSLSAVSQSLASKPRLAAEPSAFFVFVLAIQKFLSPHLSARHISDIMHIGQVFRIKYHFNPLMESSKLSIGNPILLPHLPQEIHVAVHIALVRAGRTC
jgi:hypothetical protein